MGTWSAKINGNDTFQDVYQNFFDLYNQGENPTDISKQLQEEFAEMFSDYDDRNNCLFGLALAQWETKSLDSIVFEQVKEIIETDDDLKKWKEDGADSKILEKRKKELDNFLTKISTEREKPKRRVRPKFDFEQIYIVREVSPDNLKMFEVSECYTNKIYELTSGLITQRVGDIWGGGGIIHYFEQGKYISAKWIDNQTLEITHDKDIEFSQKKDEDYFCGSIVKILYKPQ